MYEKEQTPYQPSLFEDDSQQNPGKQNLAPIDGQVRDSRPSAERNPYSSQERAQKYLLEQRDGEDLGGQQTGFPARYPEVDEGHVKSEQPGLSPHINFLPTERPLVRGEKDAARQKELIEEARQRLNESGGK